MRTDRHNHRTIAGDSADAETIKVLARGHRKLIWSRNRQSNALRSALRKYYLAALEAFESFHHSHAIAVLTRAASPAEAAHLSMPTIRSLLKELGGNARSTPGHRRYGLRCAPSISQHHRRSPPHSGPPPGLRWR